MPRYNPKKINSDTTQINKEKSDQEDLFKLLAEIENEKRYLIYLNKHFINLFSYLGAAIAPTLIQQLLELILPYLLLLNKNEREWFCQFFNISLTLCVDNIEQKLIAPTINYILPEEIINIEQDENIIRMAQYNNDTQTVLARLSYWQNISNTMSMILEAIKYLPGVPACLVLGILQYYTNLDIFLKDLFFNKWLRLPLVTSLYLNTALKKAEFTQQQLITKNSKLVNQINLLLKIFNEVTLEAVDESNSLRFHLLIIFPFAKVKPM